ncbi:hypothetical protein [Legionella feeleii]|uniref:Uncharacterized protein n=1 Tax=Legionella feeleii TaxID=453 RepID=A0A0W0U4S2_9GAMM|nr:hypothetical protein [Legionella feeleii]KTD02837.1 hypothetical protein Lfee_0675 [Legionella feeleii]SPX59930.1 Uncharacterised protein [Legionella feeleii]
MKSSKGIKRLIKLDKDYKDEKKAERIISSFWQEVDNTDLKDQSYFQNQINALKQYYFSPVKQSNCIITINQEGKFVNKKGELLDGRYIFIVNKDKQIIGLPANPRLHHSFLANGKRVRGSGYMVFENGSLKSIDNDSGHYKPSIKQMYELLSYLAKRVLNNVTFTDYSHQEDNFLYQFNLKQMVSFIKKEGYEFELLKESAVKIRPDVIRLPRTDKMSERLAYVEKNIAQLRYNLNARLCENESFDEPVYHYVSLAEDGDTQTSDKENSDIEGLMATNSWVRGVNGPA